MRKVYYRRVADLGVIFWATIHLVRPRSTAVNDVGLQIDATPKYVPIVVAAGISHEIAPLKGVNHGSVNGGTWCLEMKRLEARGTKKRIGECSLEVV